MATRIVLVSDDINFFDYIRAKLSLRKSDELLTFSFDEIIECFHLLDTAVFIVNSESSKEKTLDLLNILEDVPVIVSAFNEDNDFKKKAYSLGMFDYITLLISDSDFQARIIPAFAVTSLLEKNKQYREFLTNKKILSETSEVYLDYNYILDKKLEQIYATSSKAVFLAISPSDTTKFLLKSTTLETLILSHIRKNDILMNYAANKYFVLLFDIDIESAKKLWTKLSKSIPEQVYAGIVNIVGKNRQQLINNALNELHLEINKAKKIENTVNNPIISLGKTNADKSSYTNFKMFRQEFCKKIEQVISPVFYQMQQKYVNKLSGIILQQGTGEGYGVFYIKGKNSTSSFKITSPGFSKINIDITYQKDSDTIDSKRISLNPEELETGLLEDLLEQFINEYKIENKNI